VRIANGQLWTQFLSKTLSSRAKGSRHAIRARESLIPRDDRHLTIAALHQGNYATILNYLETELRYMDAGE
jgi:hypothetical protein